ncbi:hypothetical protein [Aquicoccus porphyridii]|uniref:hypothetical protein n=1 Tax=Aquicoccus porphyridii TaxID=1852029 RepID=UPI001FE8B763|nr:hypothetical protein [Aquicoccus porphyridii]
MADHDIALGHDEIGRAAFHPLGFVQGAHLIAQRLEQCLKGGTIGMFGRVAGLVDRLHAGNEIGYN